jgi:N-acetylglucosamine-6-sulfatase
VFTSDNGYHLGQHRLTDSTGRRKETLFDEDLRVPLFVRGPNIPAGRATTALVTLADLAPTFAAWAGVKPRQSVDGRSLVAVLGEKPPVAWRQSIPIAHWAPIDQPAANASQDFVGVRTSNHVYVRYPHFGLRDLYAVRADPGQLQNLSASADPAISGALDTLTGAVDLQRR